MDSFDLQSELERHHAESFAWALACCDFNATQAEDVLQLVYLKILSSCAVFQGRSSFKTWLFAVIRRTAANERRREFFRRALLLKWKPAAPSAMEPPDSALNRAQTATVCQDALRQLTTRQRQILHLVFYQDLTIEQAAEVMRLSIGSARTHYERAKARLRTLLAELEPVYERRKPQGSLSPGLRSR